MKILQEIFLVTYSILYGIMLNSCERLELFPFGLLFKKAEENVSTRIFASLVFINILPFMYFAGLYLFLGGINSGINIATILGTFFLSIFTFAFYRVYHVLIVIKHGDLLYDWRNFPERVKEMLKDSTLVGQSMGVLFYFLLLGIGFLLLSEITWCLIILFCTFMAGFLTIFVWFINCDTEEKAPSHPVSSSCV